MGSGNFRLDRSGFRTLRRTMDIMPALVVPRAELIVNGTSGTRRPAAWKRSLKSRS